MWRVRTMSNTQHTPRGQNTAAKQFPRCVRAHTKRTSSDSAHDSAHEVQPRPRCLAARQHTRCLCGIIPRFSCQTYASAKHASAQDIALLLVLAPHPLLTPSASAAHSDACDALLPHGSVLSDALLPHGSVLSRRIRACSILGRMDKGFLDGPCDVVQCPLNLIVAHLRNMSSLSSRCA